MNRSMDTQSAVPLHEQVYAALRNDLLTGAYRVGEKMPTTPVLLERYNVNSSTLQRAMNRLVMEGFIERAPRRGTFVRNEPGGARIAVFCHEQMLLPHADFSRSLIRAVTDSAIPQGWQVEVFSRLCEGSKNPGRVAAIAADFRKKHAQHPFRGLIEIDVHLRDLGVLSISDDFHSVGFGPRASEQSLSLNEEKLVSSCLGHLPISEVSRIVLLDSGAGIPLGPGLLEQFANQVKKHGKDFEHICLSTISARAEAEAYRLALESSSATGYVSTSERITQAVSYAHAQTEKQDPNLLIAIHKPSAFFPVKTPVYYISAMDIADSLVSALNEKMHETFFENPTPIVGHILY